jgi:hypothetical protein
MNDVVNAITDAVAEAEMKAEERWLAEFRRFTEDYESRMAARRAVWNKILTTIGYGDVTGDNISDTLLNELSRLLTMGRHFDFLLKAIKNDPVVAEHWTQLEVLLKLTEEEDVEKMYL